ncbi:MAG: AraC family transcriptional regulator [Azospirillaceae bacterium]|nr:AraC family transcriptional regulator [Azospirillaceae bacterium]
MLKVTPGSANHVPLAFDVAQTHGILRRSEHQIEKSSDRFGWTSLYVSRQYERPYADSYAAVPDHLVILHLDGPVAVERCLDGVRDRMVIPPGGIFSMPGGMPFSVRLTQPLHSVHFYLRDAILREVAAESWCGDPANIELPPCFGDVDPVIASIVQAAGHSISDTESGSTLLADHLARALASRLLARLPAQGDFQAGVLSPAQQRRLRDFMATHLAHPIGLSDMAAAVGLTPTRFSRCFRRETGTTPYHYLLSARLRHAGTLLRGSALPIAEIALACGFSHQEHLTRMFKRELGTTPAAYRRTLKH